MQVPEERVQGGEGRRFGLGWGHPARSDVALFSAFCLGPGRQGPQGAVGETRALACPAKEELPGPVWLLPPWDERPNPRISLPHLVPLSPVQDHKAR